VAIPQEVGGLTRNGGERKTQEGRSAAGAAVGVAEVIGEVLERLGGIIRRGSKWRRGQRIRRYESLITAELVTLRGAAKQILVCMARPFEYHDT
jgi:hypothetical protein